MEPEAELAAACEGAGAVVVLGAVVTAPTAEKAAARAGAGAVVVPGVVGSAGMGWWPVEAGVPPGMAAGAAGPIAVVTAAPASAAVVAGTGGDRSAVAARDAVAEPGLRVFIRSSPARPRGCQRPVARARACRGHAQRLDGSGLSSRNAVRTERTSRSMHTAWPASRAPASEPPFCLLASQRS